MNDDEMELRVKNWRLLRGLLGAAITWGAVGAMIGATMFVVRDRPWHVQSIHWQRAFVLLSMFMGSGALWGSMCGLAFGIAVWNLGRRSQLQQISALRFTIWGAVAGAAFPVLLYTPVVLMRGAYSAVPLYSMLAGISAVLGAVCGRAIFALARRGSTLASGQSEFDELSADGTFAMPTVAGRVRSP